MTDTERKLAGKIIIEHIKDGRVVERSEREIAICNKGRDELIDTFIEAVKESK